MGAPQTSGVKHVGTCPTSQGGPVILGQRMTKKQIAQALQLPEDCAVYERLRASTREVVGQESDLKNSWGQQDPAIPAEIRSQITRKYPEIFEDTGIDRGIRQRRMKAIMFYAQRYFTALRHKTANAEALIPPNRRSSTGTSTVLRSGTRLRQSTLSIHHSSPRSPTIPLRGRRTEDDDTNQRDSVLSTPANNSSASTLVNYNVRKQLTFSVTNCRVHDVASFLRACNPDMSILLDAFIGFGCRSTKLLSIVAGWPNDEIDEFLSAVVRVDPGVAAELTPMQLFLLRKHFKASFRLC